MFVKFDNRIIIIIFYLIYEKLSIFFIGAD